MLFIESIDRCPEFVHSCQPYFSKWYNNFGTSNCSFTVHFNLILRDVLFVPMFAYNLLFVSKWSKDSDGSVVFLPKSCSFYNARNTQIVATGQLLDGLYNLDLQSSSSGTLDSVYLNNVVSKRKLKLSVLWHLRLGHVSNEVMHKISAVKDHVNDLCIKECPVCPISKQTKLSFSLSDSRAP